MPGTRRWAAVLAKRRYAETQESARRLGIAEYEVLDNHDGELLPTVEVRRQVIRAIRKWKADIVIAPRPNDYHPDHRYTGVLVQDAAYMVVVPNVVSDTPPLDKNPIFLYYQDGFQKPAPFRPDVVVPLDDVWDIESQRDGRPRFAVLRMARPGWIDRLDQVPKDPSGDGRSWLSKYARAAGHRGGEEDAGGRIRPRARGQGGAHRIVRALRVWPPAHDR